VTRLERWRRHRYTGIAASPEHRHRRFAGTSRVFRRLGAKSPEGLQMSSLRACAVSERWMFHESILHVTDGNAKFHVAYQ
jgi:hypothetical protein